jgi:hypothetical protein
VQATEGISTPAKRKGRSKKVVEDGAIEQDIATAPSTRGRRKKADVVPEPEPAVVTTVPKRRHAKSSAQEGCECDFYMSFTECVLIAFTVEKPPVRQPRNQLAVEILDNLAKYPHCILLTRVGQFYEVIYIYIYPFRYALINAHFFSRSRTLIKQKKLQSYSILSSLHVLGTANVSHSVASQLPIWSVISKC